MTAKSLYTIWLLASLGCVPFTFIWGQTSSPSEVSSSNVGYRMVEALPRADDLLEGVLARMPTNPVVITGHLTADKTTNGTIPVINFEMLVNSQGGGRINGHYVISDHFGAPLARLDITRSPGWLTEWTYTVGQSLTPVQLPSLSQTIPGSEISWMDFTLGFLWWRNGQTIGRESVKDQTCYVIDLLSPTPRVDLYATVRVWIEAKFGMLLQAEAYDKTGALLRRVTIKSFKKINDQWMIKDIEIRSFPSERKTIMRVDDMHSAIPHPAVVPAKPAQTP